MLVLHLQQRDALFFCSWLPQTSQFSDLPRKLFFFPEFMPQLLDSVDEGKMENVRPRSPHFLFSYQWVHLSENERGWELPRLCFQSPHLRLLVLRHIESLAEACRRSHSHLYHARVIPPCVLSSPAHQRVFKV